MNNIVAIMLCTAVFICVSLFVTAKLRIYIADCLETLIQYFLLDVRSAHKFLIFRTAIKVNFTKCFLQHHKQSQAKDWYNKYNGSKYPKCNTRLPRVLARSEAIPRMARPIQNSISLIILQKYGFFSEA